MKDKNPEQEVPKAEVVALKTKDFLNKFYNFHLNELVSAWLNLLIFGEKDPDETVGERVVGGQPFGKGQIPATVQVKAKDALANEVKRFNTQAAILRAVERRQADLSKFTQDNELWQKTLPSPTKPDKR